MSPAPAPLQLLLLGKALTADGIHRCLNKSRGDPLIEAVAPAKVDQARFIAGDIALKLPHGGPELALIGIATVESFEIEHQIIDGSVGLIGIAIPPELPDPAQFIQSRHAGFVSAKLRPFKTAL
jgi:hypothetical protein